MEKPNITNYEWHSTGLEIRAINSLIIANVYKHEGINQPKEEAEANAKAISAVPEMIEALIEIMKVHRHVYGLDGAWDKELKQAEQALTKAGVEL
jgi:predicted ribonuclease toxin of YeeF-YezG toxin-antitoxin module